MIYKNDNRYIESTNFAKTLDFHGMRIIEFGCGNGRDVEYFSLNNGVLGIDFYAPEGQRYLKMKIEDYIVENPIPVFDVLYSRFFLHAISEELEDRIIKWASTNSKYFVAEARAEGDVPVLYTDHDRRYVNPSALLRKLLNAGFKDIKLELGHGYAVLENEDPYIIRIIAKHE